MKGCVYTATILILLLFLPVFIHARHIIHSLTLLLSRGSNGNSFPNILLASDPTYGITMEYQSNHGVNQVSRKKTVAKSEIMKSELIRRGIVQKRRGDTLEIAGSSLPDCSHACGSCRPCRLVMVSFVCSSVEEAETCPMAYKCMCHNKSYPVP